MLGTLRGTTDTRALFPTRDEYHGICVGGKEEESIFICFYHCYDFIEYASLVLPEEVIVFFSKAVSSSQRKPNKYREQQKSNTIMEQKSISLCARLLLCMAPLLVHPQSTLDCDTL